MKKDDIVLYFKSYKENKSRIGNIDIDIRNLEQDIKAQVISDMPHGTEIGNPTYNEAIRRMKDNELISLHKEKTKKLYQVEKVEEALKGLQDDEQKIITEKWINRKYWHDIDTSKLTINYSEDSLKRKFVGILNKLVRIM